MTRSWLVVDERYKDRGRLSRGGPNKYTTGVGSVETYSCCKLSKVNLACILVVVDSCLVSWDGMNHGMEPLLLLLFSFVWLASLS
jgi:hypothetical protein